MAACEIVNKFKNEAIDTYFIPYSKARGNNPIGKYFGSCAKSEPTTYFK